MLETWTGAVGAGRRFMAFQCGVIAYRGISFSKKRQKEP
jgi:hypothetical protein